ncbi:MAG: helix-turn-helix domain containing protein [Azonexus sp.]|jgi:hypothetical protein|nr:helix-turn-helix domain containing protein [Azonexus sp.]
MDFFEEAALRLKQQLKVTEDKGVAEFLGISASALNMRKKRGNFPEKELRALAQRRPELGIDVDYVLAGSVLTPLQQQRLEDNRQAAIRAGLDAATTQSLIDGIAAANKASNARRAEAYKRVIELLEFMTDEGVVTSIQQLELVLRADQNQSWQKTRDASV